jgi:hypothetical protein
MDLQKFIVFSAESRPGTGALAFLAGVALAVWLVTVLARQVIWLIYRLARMVIVAMASRSTVVATVVVCAALALGG